MFLISMHFEAALKAEIEEQKACFGRLIFLLSRKPADRVGESCLGNEVKSKGVWGPCGA